MKNHRIYDMSFASVYPHYVTKMIKKGRTEEELLQVIEWLTGYTKEHVDEVNEDERSFREFFEKAPKMNENRKLIKGVVCGVRVETIEEPLMQNIRYLDKLVDELAKGKSMDKVLKK